MEPGRLFRTLTDRELLETFYYYYDVRACDGTVTGKLKHIESVAKAAEPFFQRENDVDSANLVRENSSWLNTTANMHKNNYRKEKRAEQDVNERAELFE